MTDWLLTLMLILLGAVIVTLVLYVAAWLDDRPPKDYTPYEPLRPSEMQRPPGLWVRRGSVELYEN